jgi:hypothetical protein
MKSRLASDAGEAIKSCTMFFVFTDRDSNYSLELRKCPVLVGSIFIALTIQYEQPGNQWGGDEQRFNGQ